MSLIGARVNGRSSYSQRGLVLAWIRTQVLTAASSTPLPTELSRYPLAMNTYGIYV